MPARPLTFDLFASHAHDDEATGHVSAFLARLKAQHDAEFPGAPLSCFFDQDGIRTGNDWARTLREGVQQSRFFLAFLSPGYFASDWCRREWHAWLDHEISLHILSEGAFPIYFVEIPELTRGLSEQDIAHAIAALRQQPAPDIQRHLSQIHRRQRLVIKPFFPDGEQALREGKLDTILHSLATDLHSRRELLDSIDPHKTTVPDYNRKFTGRARELTDLRDMLIHRQTGIITGISGLGGIGKTELAFTYAHAYAAHYPGGRWYVPCEHIRDLRLALLALDGHPLPPAGDEQRKQLETHFVHILDTLQKHIAAQGPALLILDNITDLALLSPAHIRRLGGFRGQLHILATTRIPTPPGTGENSTAQWLTLDRLGENDCIDLLEKHRPFANDDTRNTAAEITRLCGAFTLAIHYSALYLAEHPTITHKNYIATLLERGIEQVEGEGTKSHPEETYGQDEKRLGIILDYTLTALTEAQRHALDSTALLGPDHIVLEWLQSLAAKRAPEFAQPAQPGRQSQWQQATARLLSLGLLSRPEKASPDETSAEYTHEILRTHRMLQQHLLHGMVDREENQRLIDAMAEDVVRQTRDVATIHARRWILPPLHALAERWDELKYEKASWLMSYVADSWYHLAEYAAAEPPTQRALAVFENSYGPEHPYVAIYLGNLAQLLKATNRLAEAEPLMRRALAIAEASHGENHPDMAGPLNNLAELLKDTNRLAEAEPLYRRALATDEASFGENHPDVARDLNNLAALLHAMNRLAEAEPLMRHALAIDEASYGLEHPNVAIRLNNLVALLRATNRLAEAEPLMRRALAIDEASYGENHPRVAIDLNNLAQLLKATNRLAEAEPLMRRALAIDEASYGPEHYNVARDLNNLATLLYTINRLAEAEPLMRRALAIDEASYGPEHYDVARDLNNLATLLRATNRLAEAESLMRRALAIHEASYGPEHPNVAISLWTLSELLQATNRLAEAEPLMRRVGVIFLKFLPATGHEHPNTRAVLGNYVWLCQEMQVPQEEIEPRLIEMFQEAGVEAGQMNEILRAVFGQSS